jgi:hypothetical protein
MINTERQFLFSCDGTSGSSQLTVRAAREPQGQPILSHRLDADDDCSQAVWTHQMFGSNSSATLVMVNPGRMELNAQMETFYVDKGVVTPSGNLPVAADKVGSSQFKLYLSETGTKWVRAYEIIRGKFAVSSDLGLMRSGSLCVAPSGEILRTSGCTGKTINALSSCAANDSQTSPYWLDADTGQLTLYDQTTIVTHRKILGEDIYEGVALCPSTDNDGRSAAYGGECYVGVKTNGRQTFSLKYWIGPNESRAPNHSRTEEMDRARKLLQALGGPR